MNFFDGPINWMWKDIRDTHSKVRQEATGSDHKGFLAPDANLPRFEMSVNRLFEAVSLFGPALYAQNPTIAVTPKQNPEVSLEAYYAADPQAQQLLAMMPAAQAGAVKDQAILQTLQLMHDEYGQVVQQEQQRDTVVGTHALILEHIANYIQHEGSKQAEARMSITEAIITGLGLLECHIESPPGGGPKIPCSYHRSYKDLVVDPDAVYWRDVKWIAIRTCEAINVCEAKFRLQPGSLKGHYATKTAVVDQKARKKTHGGKQLQGMSHDIIEYWTIYSKNGAGQHLKLRENDAAVPGLEVLGDYVKLVIADNVPYPLNLSPEVLASGDVELIVEQASWEVPYWDDYMNDGGWPIVRLGFYHKPNCIWPVGLAKSCIGELRFVNWCMSFIADKVSAGQIYVGVLKEAAEDIRQQLLSGRGPFTVIELERISGMKLQELISFLQAPSFGIDIWKMVAEVNQQIDKRLGLTELLYGMSSKQMRSAAEAQYRHENVNIRPDDMAKQVEDWLTRSSVREIQALRYTCDYEDVLPIVGPTAAQVYAEQILTQDVTTIVRDFHFEVVAGSSRKPNKETKIAQLTDMGQYILPVIQQAMLVGVTRPFNAYMKAMGRAMDFEVDEFLLGPEEQQLLLLAAQPPEKEQESGNQSTKSKASAA
jgi:hypothetical protein